ncbi:MAG: polysaccharide deacetylase family protein [Candidatus Omnitrophica bacterium]|nr:polysaccharide deacetylase family protein [Candidatus Omnitrophota bacterium]
MKRLLSKALSSVIFEAGKLSGNGRPKGLRILTYHRVDDIKGDRLSVSPAEFEKQMAWLKDHGYAGVSVKEGLTSFENDGFMPISITFDDGYLDNYANAFPVLRRYGFSATVYVITGLVSGSSSVIPAPDRDIRGQAPAGIQGNGPPLPRRRHADYHAFLSWSEISEMHRAGIEIGSHTVTHPRLPSVDFSSAKKEIEQSKQDIEEKLNVTCKSFCYPGGMWNKQLADAVRGAGYGNAATVMPGENCEGVDPFLLKRTEVSGEDSLFEFEKKVSGAYDFLHRAWQSAGMLK